MAQTLASSLTPLLPVSEFLKRVDPLAVGKLASDDPNGIPVAVGALPSNANVLAAIQDAQGLFEVAVSSGGRYSQDDIAVIAAATTTGACGTMWRILTDLAWAMLFERRPHKDVPTPASMERSLKLMDDLNDGKMIFPFIQSECAGVTTKTEASVWDVYRRNGAVVQASPFYGQRSDEDPGPYGRGW